MIHLAFAGLRHGHIYMLHTMAQSHPLFRVVGAFEEDAEARAEAERHGISCRYPHFDDLLADPNVDVAALGGCFADRGRMAIRALRAGKHVIADKPLCTSLEELNEIERLAKEKGLAVSCMFTMRFEPKINALKALAESGALGEINQVYFGGQHPLQYGRRPMWYFEAGKYGGVINDIAVHGIDILSYALGHRVEQVLAARSWNRFAKCHPDFKDSAQMMLTTDKKAGVLADVSYSIPDGIEFSLPYYWQFYVWGTNGTIGFSIGEKRSHYYLRGESSPRILAEAPPAADYLSDFYALVSGREDVILPQDAVFSATRTALEIQKSTGAD